MKANRTKKAVKLHENVPPDWYYRSIKENIFQRFWHTRRFTEVSKMLEKVEGKVLDVGCADGVFTKVVLDKTKTKEIIGIDVLPDSIKWAKNHWKRNKKMKFKVADAHDLPFPSNSFDAVVSMEMMEHVFDPFKVLKEMKRVLKKGGYAVILVPSDSVLFQLVWFLWGFYRGKVWEDTHLHTYKNNYLVTLCNKAGFEIIKSKKFLLGMLHVVKVRK